ncbi:hypothetical protein [Streptomyces deccanensis]|uniref:hypothetical protein n=1 Tax=Streptomyces deccanensis TaxID=424188 RepID=UPI001EFC1FFA|nr:hypothetical protein [Streptomyces deccanensis]ULR48466.1 hypothetical protein L3078_03800 [Streptomyces deccanensis]
MSLSYLAHHTLTPADLACFEVLVAHTKLPDHPRDEDCPGPQDPWELRLHSTCHGPDGSWRETLCVFRRRSCPDDGLYEQYVEMHFTQDGRALPGYEPDDLPVPSRSEPPGSGRLAGPAVTPTRPSRPQLR